MKKTVFLFLICCLMAGCAKAESIADTEKSEESEEQESLETREQYESSTEAEEGEWTEFPFPYKEELKKVEDEAGQETVYFTLKEAMEDYDIMWQQLEENCAYLSMAEETLGIDLEETKRIGKTFFIPQRSKGNTFLLQGFEKAISYALTDINNYGHISVMEAEFYEELLENITSGGEDAKEGWDGVRCRIKELLSNQKTKEFYDYEESRRSEGTGGTLAVENDKTVKTDKIDGIAYIKIPKCDPEQIDAIKDFLKENEHEKNIIIDIRGNSGGSTLTWTEGIVSPLIKEEVTYNSLWGIKSGKLNEYYWRQEIPDYVESNVSLSKEELKEKFSYLKIEDDIQYVWYKTTIEPGEEHYDFEGKIWLLVDKTVYSASDAFVIFCKNTGFATVVGTITGGNGEGGEPHYIVLPNSGMVIRYEPYLTFNSDGSCNAVHGGHPDIEIAEDEDALEVCLKAIAESEN